MMMMERCSDKIGNANTKMCRKYASKAKKIQMSSRPERVTLVKLEMPLMIAHLGTGSRGNCTLLSNDDYNILIDNGFSGKKLKEKLSILDITPEEIDGILISHHHGDHAKGAIIAEKKWGTNLYCNHTTANELEIIDNVNLRVFENLQKIDFGNQISVLPVPVPHEGTDNVGFIISYEGIKSAAVVTDLGASTTELEGHLRGCEHISIEANYDERKLMASNYPIGLQNRIMSRGGHLSNNQTGELLSKVVDKNTKSITLCHLSENSNKPHIAESTVLYHISEKFEGDITISKQSGPEFCHYIGQIDNERLKTYI